MLKHPTPSDQQYRPSPAATKQQAAKSRSLSRKGRGVFRPPPFLHARAGLGCDMMLENAYPAAAAQPVNAVPSHWVRTLFFVPSCHLCHFRWISAIFGIKGYHFRLIWPMLG